MMTVKEVSKLTGVSIRTLHYYDEIGLLHPTDVSEVGYRLYDSADLERLQQILLYRELEFPLKEIKAILDSTNFDRNKVLEEQIDLLTARKQHLENLITFARGIKLTGVKNMDFTVFDMKKIDEYSERAKETWGTTSAYKEYEEKSSKRSDELKKDVLRNMMNIFGEFGNMMDLSPSDEKVQQQVQKLQDYITQHFYHCTKEILAGLGAMYKGGGEFTENINQYGGSGCAEFTAKAIKVFCSEK